MPAAAFATGTDFTTSCAPDEAEGGCGCGRGGGGRGGGEVERRCPTSMLSRAAAVEPITEPVPSAGSSSDAVVGTLSAVVGVSVAGAASEAPSWAAAAAIVGPMGSWASPHKACLAEAGLVRLGRIGWAGVRSDPVEADDGRMRRSAAASWANMAAAPGLSTS